MLPKCFDAVSNRANFWKQWQCCGHWRLILGLRPANERRRYKVTPSLIGWAQTYNEPCLKAVGPVGSGSFVGLITDRTYLLTETDCELQTLFRGLYLRGKILCHHAISYGYFGYQNIQRCPKCLMPCFCPNFCKPAWGIKKPGYANYIFPRWGGYL